MNILSLQNISIKFPGNNTPALNQISYDINQEDFVILLGSNGSGKSTLLKLIHREYTADLGSIIFKGKPLDHYADKEFYQEVAVLTQDCSDSLFLSLTIYENFLLVANKKQRSQAFFQDFMIEYNPNLAKNPHQTVAQLSGGEKQALALALCFLNPPSLILLDEHTSALDPKTAAKLMDLTKTMIKKHAITCILTTHNMDLAIEYGTHILVLGEGMIKHHFSPSIKNTLTKADILSSCF